LAVTELLRDKDIREPLCDFLEERYGKMRIIEEKRMGRSREKNDWNLKTMNKEEHHASTGN
jgi:hypothetical protein